MTRARRTLAALAVALGLVGCGAEGPAPGDGGAPGCTPGAMRICSGCSAGALRTNLEGVQRCGTGADGGASWGACWCVGDGGP